MPCTSSSGWIVTASGNKQPPTTPAVTKYPSLQTKAISFTLSSRFCAATMSVNLPSWRHYLSHLLSPLACSGSQVTCYLSGQMLFRDIRVYGIMTEHVQIWVWLPHKLKRITVMLQYFACEKHLPNLEYSKDLAIYLLDICLSILQS